MEAESRVIGSKTQAVIDTATQAYLEVDPTNNAQPESVPPVKQEQKQNNAQTQRRQANPDVGVCTLHVRGVGGLLESESALTKVFQVYGEVVQTTVRHRIDEDTGDNTSWALVTMASLRLLSWL